MAAVHLRALSAMLEGRLEGRNDAQDHGVTGRSSR
jgi:hypothetical protein